MNREMTGSVMRRCPIRTPPSRWLAVYETERSGLWLSQAIQPPDGDRGLPLASTGFPLARKPANETCWFYPTENGRYLCWENQRQLQSLPGLPARPPVEGQTGELRRQACIAWFDCWRRPGPHLRGTDYQGADRFEWSTTPTKSSENWATWTFIRGGHNGRRGLQRKSPP